MAVGGNRKPTVQKEPHEIRLLRQAIKKAKNFEIRKASRKLRQAIDRETTAAGASLETDGAAKATSSRQKQGSDKLKLQLAALKALELESALRLVCAKLGLSAASSAIPTGPCKSPGENPGNEPKQASQISGETSRDPGDVAEGSNEPREAAKGGGLQGGPLADWAEQRVLGTTCVREVVVKIQAAAEAALQAAASDSEGGAVEDGGDIVLEGAAHEDAGSDEVDGETGNIRRHGLASSAAGKANVSGSRIKGDSQSKMSPVTGGANSTEGIGSGRTLKRKRVEMKEDSLAERKGGQGDGGIDKPESKRVSKRAELRESKEEEESLENPFFKSGLEKLMAGSHKHSKQGKGSMSALEEDDFFVPDSPRMNGDLEPGNSMEVSESDADFSDSEEDVGVASLEPAQGSTKKRRKSRESNGPKAKKKSKNRLGQRERQRLAEMKYGTNAKHIKKGPTPADGKTRGRLGANGRPNKFPPHNDKSESRHARGFPSKILIRGTKRPTSGEEQKHDKHAGRRPSEKSLSLAKREDRGSEGRQAGKNSEGRSDRGPTSKRDEAAALHPSWAAKAAQSKQLAIPGTGKKIKFSDDD